MLPYKRTVFKIIVFMFLSVYFAHTYSSIRPSSLPLSSVWVPFFCLNITVKVSFPSLAMWELRKQNSKGCQNQSSHSDLNEILHSVILGFVQRNHNKGRSEETWILTQDTCLPWTRLYLLYLSIAISKASPQSGVSVSDLFCNRLNCSQEIKKQKSIFILMRCKMFPLGLLMSYFHDLR